jgi:hypothetical protein
VAVEPEPGRVVRARTNRAPAAKKKTNPTIVGLVMVMACSGIGRDGPHAKRSGSRRKWIDDEVIVSMPFRNLRDPLGNRRPNGLAAWRVCAHSLRWDLASPPLKRGGAADRDSGLCRHEVSDDRANIGAMIIPSVRRAGMHRA